MMKNLAERFANAGLDLKLLQTPLANADPAVFQLDIETSVGRRRRERFRVWPGYTDNRAMVLGTDARLRQLVLFVDEPKRTFVADVPTRVLRSAMRNFGRRWLGPVCRQQGIRSEDIVLVRSDPVDPALRVRRSTEGRALHYLCGADESHLFISNLPRGVSTVRDAHAALKSPAVVAAEPALGGDVVRQGEWFFLPASAEEKTFIERGLATTSLAVRFKEGLQAPGAAGRWGKPHRADECVRIFDPRAVTGHPLAGLPAAIRRGPYVRGAVRHPDHATLVLTDWHLVTLNEERRSATTAIFGWVD